jgi:hypothetical protein
VFEVTWPDVPARPARAAHASERMAGTREKVLRSDRASYLRKRNEGTRPARVLR